MGINKVEISRNRGTSLFVGPGALGVMPCGGFGDRDRTVLRHALASDAKLFTLRGIVDSFPTQGRDDLLAREEVENIFRQVIASLNSLLPEEAGLALGLFEQAEKSGKCRALPAKLKNLEFDRLYFLVRGECRAMINMVLKEKPRKIDFTIWAGNETIVATHERVQAVLGDVSENRGGRIDSQDVQRASDALGAMRSLNGDRSPDGLNDMLSVISDPRYRVADLMRVYRRR